MSTDQKEEVSLQTYPKLMTEKYLKEPTEIERYVAYISDCEEWKIYFEAKHVTIRDNPKKWLEEHIGDYKASTPENILQIFIDEEILKE